MYFKVKYPLNKWVVIWIIRQVSNEH